MYMIKSSLKTTKKRNCWNQNNFT